MGKNKTNNQRPVAALILFYFFIILTVSSIVLYIMPHGRVAYWTGWKFLGLNKEQWDALHIISGIIVICSAIWHTIINLQPLKRYLVSRKSLAVALVALITTIGTIYNIPPFKTVIDIQEKIKRSWAKNVRKSPIPHAELLTLKEFCQELHIPLQAAVYKLSKYGISIPSVNITIKELSELNKTTPMNIYSILIKSNMKSSQNKSYNNNIRMGLGRLTLKEFCISNGLTVAECIDKLQQKNIIATPDETLREIAAKNGLLPRDIANIIQR